MSVPRRQRMAPASDWPAAPQTPTALKCSPPMPAITCVAVVSMSRMLDVIVAGSGGSTPTKSTGKTEPLVGLSAAR